MKSAPPSKYSLWFTSKLGRRVFQTWMGSLAASLILGILTYFVFSAVEATCFLICRSVARLLVGGNKAKSE